MLGEFTELLEIMHTNFPWTYYPELFIRIIVATLCGLVIGLERTKRQKAAGIRTHCVIAAASAVMMILSKYAFADITTSAGELYESSRGADVSRIASQVVSGVGFLGAGVIFVKGGSIKGLTTAAGIWAISGIGMAIGAGMYPIGLFTTLVVLLLNLIFHKLHVGDDAYSTHEIEVEMLDTPEMRKVLEDILDQYKTQVLDCRIARTDDHYIAMELSVKMTGKIPFGDCLRIMDENPGLRKLSM